MDKNYKFKNALRAAFLTVLAGFAGSSWAQLSGTYTIDTANATSGTNFKTWADFRSSLVTNGVNGAVTVNVVTDAVETGQINLPQITGASSTNTITINGNGRILMAGVNDGVLLFDGIDYITFDGLVIRNTNNNANVKCVRVQNGSDYNTFKNCTFEFSTLTATSTTSSAYIAFSTSSTSSTTTNATNHGAFNVIDNNLFRTINVNSPGPAFGIAIQGSSSSYTSTAQNNTISNNRIQNFYSMAIRMYNTNGNQVLNNDISRANATSYNSASTIYGVYSYNSYAASRQTRIDNNYIHDMPFSGATTSTAPTTVYGFYNYFNYGNATYRFSVSNNTIEKNRASQYFYLGYDYYSYFLDIIGNTATDNDVTVSTSSSYQFYGWQIYYTQNNYRINNNTIQNCDGGYWWYGIRSEYPSSACTFGEINGNTIQNNANAYYYHYSIRSAYAYNSAAYPISISDNLIQGNTSNYYYHYSVYAYFYGNYNIERNIIRNNRNTSNSTSYYHYSIYNYYNYNTKVNSNLIVDNAAYYYTYPIYNYSFVSGNYSTEVRQNTVRANGSLTNNSSPYVYAIYQYQ
ncbi:MAG: hypothetical protein JNM67_08345, partial [Bacteroidetes bacterium]|nr:hypothetical protein [Bacteroidota bacterium]